VYLLQGSLAVIDRQKASRLIVFGDLHGDLAALEKGLGLRRTGDLLIFLGDYADRGARGVEILEGISALKARIPGKVIALKGNHEEYDDAGNPAFSPCTLMEEASRKRGSWDSFFPFLSRFTEGLALAALLPGYALFAHGGIGNEITSLEVLQNPSRETERQLLWGDPIPEQGEYQSYRGAGRVFGPDVSNAVLSTLGVRKFFRSHEPRKAFSGPAIEHAGRVITTSATGIYGGRPFVLILESGSLPMTEGELVDSTFFLDE